MAVPGTGAISLGQIRQELQTANYAAGVYTATATELDDAENGGYKTINICSPSYPIAANPAKMSEWYGYDHDAPCDYSTSSYYFEGGDPSRYTAPTNLLTNIGLDYANNYVLQADFVQGFSFSFWVRPSTLLEAYNTFNDNYQRQYGLWSVRDYQNDYVANLTYWPVHAGQNSSHYLKFAKFNGPTSGSSGQQFWEFDLSDGRENENVTGLDINADAWDIDQNPGNLGQCGFVHLTIAYDPNAARNEDIVKLWWNATGLTGSYTAFGSMWSNLNYTNSRCHLAIGHNQFNFNGGGLPRSQTTPVGDGGSWYGNIDWYTHTDQYIWGLNDVKDLYNNGSGSAISNLSSIQGNNVEHFTFGEKKSSGIIDGEIQQAELQVTASHDTSFFIRC